MTQIRWVILVLLGWSEVLARSCGSVAKGQANDYSGFQHSVNALKPDRRIVDHCDMIIFEIIVDYYINIILQNLRINQFLDIIDWFPMQPAGCDDESANPPLHQGRPWRHHHLATLTGDNHPVACIIIDPEIAAGAMNANFHFISDA